MTKATLDPTTGLVHVEFDWSPEYGDCYDCGLPAAYKTDDPPAHILCSVCAAAAAAEGERITWLFADDFR